jgi:uncharacterized membrane protein YvbJ
MYCINCGAQIPENSKYCPHCGFQQSHNLASINEKLAEKIIEKEIVRQINEEYQSSINFQFLKKSIGWYLAWVLLHLAFLLIWADNIISDGWRFYPFSAVSDITDYDIREFLVYTIFPLITLLIISMVQTPKTEVKQNKVTYSTTYKSPEKIFEEKKQKFNIGFTLFVVVIIVLFYIIMTSE